MMELQAVNHTEIHFDGKIYNLDQPEITKVTANDEVIALRVVNHMTIGDINPKLVRIVHHLRVRDKS